MGTRDSLLDAAAQVLREEGFAVATTRRIAGQAGFTEATLYKHFLDKVDLMIAVLRERTRGYAELTAALTATEGGLEQRLAAVARAAIGFYQENFPMLASIFASRKLLDAHKAGLEAHGGGPHLVNEAIIGFLRREEQAGAIVAGADLVAAAGLFTGACFQFAFLGQLGAPGQLDVDDAARGFARTLLAGLTRG